MIVEELDQNIVRVMKALAGEPAEAFIHEAWLPSLRRATGLEQATIEDLRAALLDPKIALRTFFHGYAFARRGKERIILSELAVEALDRLGSLREFRQVLEQRDGDRLWKSFQEACAVRNIKPNEANNYGVIAGMLELAQEIYAEDGVGSLAKWIVEGFHTTGRIERQFLRIVDVRGVGPKGTSTFMRDMIQLFGLEDKLENVDRLYVQPVDRWMRTFAVGAFPEIGDEAPADWVVAGKVSKYCRKIGVSGIRFNMGLTWFGFHSARDPKELLKTVATLVLNTLEKEA